MKMNCKERMGGKTGDIYHKVGGMMPNIHTAKISGNDTYSKKGDVYSNVHSI